MDFICLLFPDQFYWHVQVQWIHIADSGMQIITVAVALSFLKGFSVSSVLAHWLCAWLEQSLSNQSSCNIAIFCRMCLEKRPEIHIIFYPGYSLPNLAIRILFLTPKSCHLLAWFLNYFCLCFVIFCGGTGATNNKRNSIFEVLDCFFHCFQVYVDRNTLSIEISEIQSNPTVHTFPQRQPKWYFNKNAFHSKAYHLCNS